MRDPGITTTEADGRNRTLYMPKPAALQAATASALPLVDNGGPVLAASKTWAIYWGPAAAFPADLPVARDVARDGVRI